MGVVDISDYPRPNDVREVPLPKDGCTSLKRVCRETDSGAKRAG